MDGIRFDTLTRGLVRLTSRRRALGGAIGAVVTMLTAVPAFAARDKHRRDGDRVEDSPVAPGALAGGIWEESIEICQFDPETGDYVVKAVSMVSLPDHLNKGDTLHIDCCVYENCQKRQCLRVTGCIEGACAYDATEGEACGLGGSVMGVCNRKGVCVSTAPVVPDEATTGDVIVID